jgi:hypothetical protein
MRQSNALRFSLRTLLIVITFVAVGCTALLNANDWWAGSLQALGGALCSFAILLAVYRTGETRAACLGFVICGVVLYNWSHFPFESNQIFDSINMVA